MKGGGLCGLHAATRIIRRITRAPRAIPRMAAFEIVAEKRNITHEVLFSSTQANMIY